MTDNNNDEPFDQDQRGSLERRLADFFERRGVANPFGSTPDPTEEDFASLLEAHQSSHQIQHDRLEDQVDKLHTSVGLINDTIEGLVDDVRGLHQTADPNGPFEEQFASVIRRYLAQKEGIDGGGRIIPEETENALDRIFEDFKKDLRYVKSSVRDANAQADTLERRIEGVREMANDAGSDIIRLQKDHDHEHKMWVEYVAKEAEKEAEFEEKLKRDIRRDWWLIPLLIVLCAAAVFIISLGVTKAAYDRHNDKAVHGHDIAADMDEFQEEYAGELSLVIAEVRNLWATVHFQDRIIDCLRDPGNYFDEEDIHEVAATKCSPYRIWKNQQTPNDEEG